MKIDIFKERQINLTLDELTLDLGAFMCFLQENQNVNGNQTEVKSEGLPSYWMLIPKGLDVEFRKGVEEFKLEKDVHSRTIVIVTKEIPVEERPKKRLELLRRFSPILAQDQASQIIYFLKMLTPEAREELLARYDEYRERNGNE